MYNIYFDIVGWVGLNGVIVFVYNRKVHCTESSNWWKFTFKWCWQRILGFDKTHQQAKFLLALPQMKKPIDNFATEMCKDYWHNPPLRLPNFSCRNWSDLDWIVITNLYAHVLVEPWTLAERMNEWSIYQFIASKWMRVERFCIWIVGVCTIVYKLLWLFHYLR